MKDLDYMHEVEVAACGSATQDEIRALFLRKRKESREMIYGS